MKSSRVLCIEWLSVERKRLKLRVGSRKVVSAPGAGGKGAGEGDRVLDYPRQSQLTSVIPVQW